MSLKLPPKKKNPLLFATLIVFSLIFIFNFVMAQDYWGMAKTPFMGHVSSMDVNSGDDIFIGTWGGGVYKSADDGVNWTAMNSGLTELYINRVRITSDGRIYACTEGSGIFMSTNNGNDWSQINNGLTNLNVRDVNRHSNGTLFAGTYGDGVFRSIDDGATWEPVNNGLHFMDIRSITFAINNDYVVAGTWGGGIYRSPDNGDSWVSGNSRLTNMYIRDMVVNSAGEIYAATNGGGVVFSVDNASGWSEFDTNKVDKNITCLVFDDDNELVVGTMAEGILYYDEMIYVDWMRSNIRSYGVTAIAKNSSGDLFASVPFEGVYKCTNGGQNWDKTGFEFDEGITQMVVNEDNGNIIMYLGDDKAYYSEDKGMTWASAGLDTFTVVQFAFDNNNGIYAATGRTGVHFSNNKGASWQELAFRDSTLFNVAVAPNGDVWIGGLHFVAGRPPVFDPFMARSTDQGQTWIIHKIFPDTTQCTGIGINSNGDIYVGAQRVGLYKTTDNGNNWQFHDVASNDDGIVSIDFNSSGHVFLGAMNGVYKSTNGGTSFNLYDMGIDMPVSSGVSVNTSEDVHASFLYGVGHYMTTNSGSEWDSTNNSFPVVPVSGVDSDSDGFTYIAADVIYESIDPAELDPPTLLYPSHDTAGVVISPVLSWNSVEFADLYELQLSTKSDFSFKIEYVTLAPTYRDIERELDYNTAYYWRVRAKRHSALGDWSETRKFTTNLMPPMLISPENDARGVAQTFDFTWHGVDGAENYDMQIATDIDFTTIEHDITDNADSVKNIADLLPLTQYYWRARAKGESTISDWSETWTFLTVVAPPVLRMPPNNSINHPPDVLTEWDTSRAATRYYIQVSKTEDFTTPIFDGQANENDQHSFTQLEPNTKFFWRVQAANDDGNSLYSEVWNFTTGYGAPQLISPDNNSINASTVVSFLWGAVEGAPMYQLQVAMDAGFTDMFYDENDIPETSQEVPGMAGFTSYFWRVRVVSDDTLGNWSEVWTYRTGLAAPILTSPENNSVDQPLAFYLTWEEVVGAKLYHVQVAKDTDFSDIVVDQDSLTSNQKGLTQLEYETSYYWRVKAFNDDGESPWSAIWTFRTLDDPESVGELPAALNSVSLYPNPFRDKLNISVSLKSPSNVGFKIFNVLGEEVGNINSRLLPAGISILNWNAYGLIPSTYYYHLIIDGVIVPGQVVLIGD